jgi:ankyrin repeat protein
VAASTAFDPNARTEQKRLYEEEIKLAEKQLAAQQKRVETGNIAPDELIPAQRDLLELKRKLAALGSGASGTESSSQPTTSLTSTEAEEVKRIQTMIKNSPDLINARDQASTTPLHRAATAGQLVVAEFLLQNGAEIEARGPNGRTPLHYASSAGQKAMVELLLKNKASVLATDSEGYTALHLAAENGMRNVAELLLASGIDINAKSRKNVTPLHLAIANSFNSVATLLIDRHANLDIVADYFPEKNWWGTPLHVAAYKGDEAIAALLLAKKANPKIIDGAGQTPLLAAVSRRNLGVAKQLLAQGVDVNEKVPDGKQADRTALHFALMNGQKEMVELLLRYKADPNARFDASLDPSQKGLTPLVLAAWQRLPEIVELLLAANADPNLKSDNGRAPILEALQNPATTQRLKMTKVLLEHGANPNVRDFEQATPLMRAVFIGDKEIVELLLAHKAEVNAQDKNGRSALHYASWALQSSGGFVPGTPQSGRDMTPIAELLIASGADVNARTKEGITPLKWAEPLKTPFSDTMAMLLRNHGALEDVPRLDVIQIRRPGSNYDGAIVSSTNHWNDFTFLEVFAMENGILTKNPQGELQTTRFLAQWAGLHPFLAFPNLEKVRIRRPAADLKSWQDKIIDNSPTLASGDCSKDFRLEWGDVVEVVEADHPLNETWPGFSATEWTNLIKCLSRDVEIIVKGKSTKVTLQVGLTFGRTPEGLPGGPPLQITTMTPFWIKPALRKTNLLLASSDLAHVRVKRVDPTTGERREWILDCSDSKPAPEFWLRDGDVIEVPDKT